MPDLDRVKAALWVPDNGPFWRGGNVIQRVKGVAALNQLQELVVVNPRVPAPIHVKLCAHRG